MLWDFSVARSIAIVVRTWPFTMLRLLVYAGITLAFVVATGTGAGLGWGVGHVGDSDFRHAATVWGGLAGAGAVSLWVWTLREYLLYLVGAGHVAAMVAAFDGSDLPAGRSQIDEALAAVKSRFGEIHLLFVLDQLVRGAIGAVTGLLGGIAAFTGLPGLEGLVRIAGAVVKMSTTFLDELVLARDLRLASADPWTSARESIVLYAQNAPAVLKNAVWLTVLRWLAALVLFLVMMGPASALVWFVPGSATGWVFVFALIMAIGLQKALLDPFCIAALMQVYFAAIEGQRPDPAWDARLAAASKPFRELVDKARGAFRPSAAGPAA